MAPQVDAVPVYLVAGFTALEWCEQWACEVFNSFSPCMSRARTSSSVISGLPSKQTRYLREDNSDYQAYFSRPTRSINHARISEISDDKKHKTLKAASTAELNAFLEAWPNVDPSRRAQCLVARSLLVGRKAKA
jgi:hypothetical protein